MRRAEFRDRFGTAGPAVFPVIHVLSRAQIAANLALVAEAGAAGAFLINHDFGRDRFLPLWREARSAWPGLWLGVNFLAEDGRAGFPVLGQLAIEGLAPQALWADDARIDERRVAQPEAEEITAVREASGWRGLYFGGVAFKKQRPVADADLPRAAALAGAHVDVATTSGVATGQAADRGRIAALRAALGDRPLGLASGVTPENAALYAADVDAILVATGINRPGDFYTIDAARLTALLEICCEEGTLP